VIVSLAEVQAAAQRLRGVVVQTPLLPSDVLSDESDGEVRLKCENLQRAGSFKARGAVMNACTRDLWKLAEMDFPIFGMGYHPADSKGRLDIDVLGEPIEIGGVRIAPGDFIIGDGDGVVAIPREAIEDVIRLGREKVTGENTVREELRRGDSLGEVFARHGIL